MILAAVDTSAMATQVLIKAAELARRSNGEVIVLHVINTSDAEGIEFLEKKTQRILADIRHQFITITGSVPESIIRIAENYQVTDIVMGKRGHQSWETLLVGSVSQAVLESSLIPVILVENESIVK